MKEYLNKGKRGTSLQLMPKKLSTIGKRKKVKRLTMKIVMDPIMGWPVLKGPAGTPKLTSAKVKTMLADFP